MDPVATLVIVLVVLVLLAVLAWGWTTRAGLLRMRELATGAGEQVERQRSRRDELQAAAASTEDAGARRALADSQRRLSGDAAFHLAGVRAYNTRLAKAPASLVAAVCGLHPLPEPRLQAGPVEQAPAGGTGHEATGHEGPRAAGATRAEPPRD